MVLDFLKGQLWWILQVTGSMGVLVALMYSRIHGLCLKSYIVYLIMTITTASWMFMKSYEIAPSFFQAWFIGTGALALLGFGANYFYFNEVVSVTNYVGAIIALAGSLLLIL
jgi:hypothetical protein